MRTSLGLALALLVPLASADQTQGELYVKASFGASELTLSDSGSGVAAVTVRAWITNTVCVQKRTYQADLRTVYADAWAGASLRPTFVRFEVPTGQDNSNRSIPAQAVSLDMRWDVDSAPERNAQSNYTVEVTDVKIADVPDAQGVCQPEVSRTTREKSERLHVILPDKPVENRSAENPSICLENPGAPGCASTSSAPPAEKSSPGPGFVLVMAAVVAAAWHLRPQK